MFVKFDASTFSRKCFLLKFRIIKNDGDIRKPRIDIDLEYHQKREKLVNMSKYLKSYIIRKKTLKKLIKCIPRTSNAQNKRLFRCNNLICQNYVFCFSDIIRRSA